MSEKKEITLEQLQEYFKTTKLSDAKQRTVAKNLGLELPIEELSVQLQKVELVRGHVGKATKQNPNPQPKNYIKVPSVKMKDDGARGFWVRDKIARAVCNQILTVLDAEGIE